MAFGASVLLSVVLAACAAQVDLPALPSSHPAHPAAAAAEPIRPSDLLERTAPVPAAEPAATGGDGHLVHGTPDEPHEHRHDPATPPTERR